MGHYLGTAIDGFRGTTSIPSLSSPACILPLYLVTDGDSNAEMYQGDLLLLPFKEAVYLTQHFH